jgi:hypothetical protein
VLRSRRGEIINNDKYSKILLISIGTLLHIFCEVSYDINPFI